MARDRKNYLLVPAKPPGILNSIFVSSATAASKMLSAAASSVSPAAAGGGGGGGGDGGWPRPMDHVRHVLMITIWANVWVLRILMDAFPPPRGGGGGGDSAAEDQFPGVEGLICPREEEESSSSSSSSSSSLAMVSYGGVESGGESTAIERALTHMLGILNETPATSRKYEQVLAMADRVVADNIESGHPSVLRATRSALSSAFSRTSHLLRRSLRPDDDRSRSPLSPAALHSRALRLLPPGPRTVYDGLRLCLSGLLPSAAAGVVGVAGSPERPEAEKLAQELLWTAERMRACGAAGEAIARWSFASGLASLALAAHPRVQGPIVKLTVVLIRDLERGEWDAAREVRFGILALWLPVLCHASSGVTSPVVAGSERREAERAIEELIVGLPHDDQEIVLRNWLEDFAASDSDWPNLRRSFDRWCRNSRKQHLFLLS